MQCEVNDTNMTKDKKHNTKKLESLYLLFFFFGSYRQIVHLSQQKGDWKWFLRRHSLSPYLRHCRVASTVVMHSANDLSVIFNIE